MKTSYLSRNSTRIAAGLTGLALLALWSLSASGQEHKTASRVGIYDSRSVAVAHAGSTNHARALAELRAAHKQAKDAGDSTKAAELEARGRAWQAEAHARAFGTAPVDDLLAQIPDAVAAVKKELNLTAIVSKWDKAALEKHSGAQTIDITMKLVDAFHPIERQRQYALDIQKHKPMATEDARRIKD